MGKIQLYINNDKAIQLLNDLRYGIPANYEDYTYKAYYNGMYQDVSEKVINYKKNKYNLALESFMKDTLKGNRIRKYFIPEKVYNEKNDTSYDITFYQLHKVNDVHVSKYVKNKIENNEYVNTNYVDNQGYNAKYSDSVVYRMYDKERNAFVYIEASYQYDKVIFTIHDVQYNTIYEFNLDYITRLDDNKNRENEILTYSDLVMLGHDLYNHYQSGQLSKAVVNQLVTREYDEKDVKVKSMFTDVINSNAKNGHIRFIEENIALLTNKYSKNAVLLNVISHYDKDNNPVYIKLPDVKRIYKSLEYINEEDIEKSLSRKKIQFIDIYACNFYKITEIDDENLYNKIHYTTLVEVELILVEDEGSNYYIPVYTITNNRKKYELEENVFNNFCNELAECTNFDEVQLIYDNYLDYKEDYPEKFVESEGFNISELINKKNINE